MAKTAAINMRVSSEVKSNVESIFASLGMTLTEAINVFLHKSVMEGGLPIDVRQPRYNAETEAAIQESRDIMAGTCWRVIVQRLKERRCMETVRGVCEGSAGSTWAHGLCHGGERIFLQNHQCT